MTIMRMIAALTVVALFTGCATNSLTGRRQLTLVSESQAISASSQAYSQMMGTFEADNQLNNDRTSVQRVRSITSRLVAQAVQLEPRSQDWDWAVQVLDVPDQANAFCMAGGKMAIYSGLIDQLNATDDEIAAVMGHEIAHALLAHSVEKMSMSMVTNLGVQALGTAFEDKPLVLSGTEMAAAVAVTLPNSRTAEAEADIIGLEIAARAGYNPSAAITLWQKMNELNGGGPMEFLSTHPAPQTRIEGIQANLPTMMPLYQASRGQRLPTWPVN